MRAAEFVSEEWSEKYKRSIDCSHPKGFSQRAHCAGRKKNEDIESKETKYQVVCDGTRKGIFADKNEAIANAKSMFKHEKEYYHIAVVDLNTGDEVWTWDKKQVAEGYSDEEHPIRNDQGVEAWGYVYNNRDQRVMWRREFSSQAAAQRWADSKNATVMGMRPAQQPVEEEQLDELSFLGSQCTKDCSGHRAGYAWSQKHGGMDSASWSPSFNKGAWLHNNGF